MNPFEKFRTDPEYVQLSQRVDALNSDGPPELAIVHRPSAAIGESGRKLGIFSGSFHPLTVAHTKIVEEAQARFQLDELLLLLAKANVDKAVFGWPLAGRLLTLKRYAENRAGVSVALSSHGRYLDKLSALEAVYPRQTEYHFIVGYDTLVRIFDPKYYTDVHGELRELFAACRFIAVNREQADVKVIMEFLAQPAIQPYSEFITYLGLPDFYAQISSTAVREQIARGDSIAHLVPPIITEFLE